MNSHCFSKFSIHKSFQVYCRTKIFRKYFHDISGMASQNVKIGDGSKDFLKHCWFDIFFFTWASHKMNTIDIYCAHCFEFKYTFVVVCFCLFSAYKTYIEVLEANLLKKKKVVLLFWKWMAVIKWYSSAQ